MSVVSRLSEIIVDLDLINKTISVGFKTTKVVLQSAPFEQNFVMLQDPAFSLMVLYG